MSETVIKNADISGNGKVEFQIGVNGTAETWNHQKINYEQLVRLAFPNGPFGGDIRYTITWTKPDGEEGSLRRGEHVEITEGMKFDVRNTDKS